MSKKNRIEVSSCRKKNGIIFILPDEQTTLRKNIIYGKSLTIVGIFFKIGSMPFLTENLLPMATTASAFLCNILFSPLIPYSCELLSSNPSFLVFGQEEDDFVITVIYSCLSIIIIGIFHFPDYLWHFLSQLLPLCSMLPG